MSTKHRAAAKRRGAAMAIAAAITTLLSTVPASAQATGATTLSLDRAALRADGIRVTAVRPARLAGAGLRIPVTAGTTARLDHGGGLVLRRGSRVARLTRLRTSLGRPTTVSALVGGRRVTLLTVSPGAKVDAGRGTATLSGRLTLTRAGAASIARRLGLRRLRSRRIGRIATDALIGRTAPGTADGTRSPGSGSSSSPSGGSSTTGPGGQPQTTPIADEPPVPVRPASAVSVTSATVNWHVRDSFIQYVNSAVGPGEGTNVARGATKGPETVRPGSPMPLVYDFGYPFAQGWFDAASNTSATSFTGTVNFRHSLHGIDLDAKDAEIEIAGGRSRAIFRFDGRQSTRPGDKRAVLVDLHLDRAGSITTSPDGRTHTYAVVPGTVAEGSQSSVFAGFYEPGDEFGWIDLSFTTG